MPTDDRTHDKISGALTDAIDIALELGWTKEQIREEFEYQLENAEVF